MIEAALSQDNLDELIAGDAVLPDNETGEILVRRFTQEAARYHPEQVVNLIDSLPEGRRRNAALSGFASEWAATAPEEAANWAASLEGREGAAALQSVFSVWTRDGGSAAIAAWAVAQRAGPQLDSALGALFTPAVTWKAQDAAAVVNTISDPAIREAAVQRLALYPRLSPAERFDFARQLTDERGRRTLLFSTAAQWGRAAREEARQAISAMSDLSDQERAGLLDILDRQPSPPPR